MNPSGNNDLPSTALITGASRRIGAAIARDLAASGVYVIIHHKHSFVEADKLCDEIIAKGGKASSLQADLNSVPAIEQLFEQATLMNGPVDLLINNASVFEEDPKDHFDETVWDQHFNLHVKAPSLLSHLLARQEALQQGLIINLIDQRVWRLTPKFHSYTLSKAALWAATQTLAQSFAPKIRVNAIGPGPTLANERQSAEDFQTQVDGLILKTGPQMSAFAETVLYFWRMKSVTGQMIALDGGQHLAWQTPDILDVKE